MLLCTRDGSSTHVMYKNDRQACLKQGMLDPVVCVSVPQEVCARHLEHNPCGGAHNAAKIAPHHATVSLLQPSELMPAAVTSHCTVTASASHEHTMNGPYGGTNNQHSTQV